jgi:hypothetical protein
LEVEIINNNMSKKDFIAFECIRADDEVSEGLPVQDLLNGCAKRFPRLAGPVVFAVPPVVEVVVGVLVLEAGLPLG